MSVERTEQYAQVMKRLRELEARVVNVGFFDTAKYEDGTPVAYVAAIQEFGHGPIPPRPFMRPAMADNRGQWGDLYQRGAKRVIEGSLSPDQMLGTIGEVAAGNVKKAIVDVTAPPLSPITLLLRQRKKSGEKITGRTVGNAAAASGFLPTDGAAAALGVDDKPLVDSGYLLQSVSSKVTQE